MNDSSLASPRDRAVFRRSDLFGGIELMRARFVHHSFIPHTHDELMIGIVRAGTKAFRHTRSRRLAGRGMLSVVNAGEVHTGERQSGDVLEYDAFYLSGASTGEILGDARGPEFEIGPPVIEDAEVWRALSRAHRSMMSAADAFMAEELMILGVAELVGRYAVRRLRVSTQPHPEAVKRAVAHIHDETAGPKSLDAIARCAAVGTFHLIRLFQKHLGLSPHAYVTQVRIDRGKILLRAGIPVAQVAHDLGFADQAHFTKRFKQLTGATPAQYASLL